MTDTATLSLAAIIAAAKHLRYTVEPTQDALISDLCRDSLDRVEFLISIEDQLCDAGHAIEIDDANAPGMDATIGELANYIAERHDVNGVLSTKEGE